VGVVWERLFFSAAYQLNLNRIFGLGPKSLQRRGWSETICAIAFTNRLAGSGTGLHTVGVPMCPCWGPELLGSLHLEALC